MQAARTPERMKEAQEEPAIEYTPPHAEQARGLSVSSLSLSSLSVSSLLDHPQHNIMRRAQSTLFSHESTEGRERWRRLQSITYASYGMIRHARIGTTPVRPSSNTASTAMARSNSFQDLPPVALAGITSRVSIGSVTSLLGPDLQPLFQAADSIDSEAPLDFEAVIVEGGWTSALLCSASGALLSALAFGYNNANMNTQASVMRDALGLPARLPASCSPDGESVALLANDAMWGFCVSVFCISALLGSMAAGHLADRHGRRRFLLGNSLVYIVAAVLEASCGPVAAAAAVDEPAELCAPAVRQGAIGVLLVGRLLTGVACGGSTVVVPMYLGEAAPAHLRGTLGSSFLFTAVTGMLLGQLAGLPSILGTVALWPLVLAGGVLPALIQLLFFPSALVESPRWLITNGQLYDAAQTLALLRGCDPDADDLRQELELMMGEGTLPPAAEATMGKRRLAYGDERFDALSEPMLPPNAAVATPHLLMERSVRKPLVICLTLMAAQQLSGINNAFNYSSTFFAANGLDDATITSIAVAMNVGCTARPCTCIIHTHAPYTCTIHMHPKHT